MARTRSIGSYDTEIAKTEKELATLQEKCDALTEKLLNLQNQKLEAEAKQIMGAYQRSDKSLEEIMTFLNP